MASTVKLEDAPPRNDPLAMSRHDGLALIGLSVFAFCIAIFYAIGEGVTANSVIYISGLSTSIAITLWAMRRDSAAQGNDRKGLTASGTATIIEGVKDFMLKRGILFALVQAPILTFFAGFFFRWTSYTVAVFIVLASFMVLPAWVSYRKPVSDDPEEPVHRLYVYVICSCSAAAAFSLFRVPLHYMWGYVYWGPWFSFGSELSGLGSHTSGALAAGAALYTIHGMTLGLGYYILFKRHTLLNAILLLTFYLASLYSLLFPVLARFGQQTDWVFHVTNWSAHLCVAVASWYSLKYWTENATRLMPAKRMLVAALPIALAIMPVGFAFYRTAMWIEPTQLAIDEGVFNRSGLVTFNGINALRVSGDHDSPLQFTLRVGPRTYENFNHKKKSLDLRQIKISGRVLDGETAVAWCAQHIDNLESPNKIKTSNADYFAGIEQMNYVDIPVRCMGNADALKATRLSALKITWTLQATLAGDRNQRTQTFTGAYAPGSAPAAQTTPVALIGKT
jgi:hypothetical protein